MTRVLLATLVFYRRWLSPALHSLNPGGGCRCTHLFGVRLDRYRHPWPPARHGPCGLEAAALQSIGPRRP